MTLEQFLDGAAAAGWRTVGLDDYTLHGRAVDDLAEQLRSRGLTCSDVGVLPLGAPDVLDAARRLAAIGEASGAPVCIAAVAGEIDRADAGRELRACTEILDASGIRLALEFVSFGGLTRLDDAIDLCDDAGWDRCGLLVDTWHFFRTDAPWHALARLAPEQIALVHINDGPAAPAADAVHESRFGRLPLGAGAFPLQEFAAALGRYSGPLSSEVLSDAIRLAPVAAGARVVREGIERSWPG